MKRITFLLLLLCLICAPAWAQAGEVLASWYGFESGTRTANGERFDPNAMTCAYWHAPFGTLLRVSYHGRAMVCRVNDRGPAKWTGRGIDLSLGAARAIGLIAAGVARVSVERL